jgi:hypothetical protein
MVRRPGFTGGDTYGGVERVWEARVSEGASQGLSGRFYRARRREEGASAGIMAINGHGGPAALIAFKGEGALQRENGRY